MKAEEKALGFSQGLAAETEALKSTPIQFQRLLQSPQRAQVHRKSGSPHFQGVLGADDAPVRHQKSGPSRRGPSAADAAPQLGAQTECIQGPQLKEDS